MYGGSVSSLTTTPQKMNNGVISGGAIDEAHWGEGAIAEMT